MSTLAKRPVDLAEPSSFAEPVNDMTPSIDGRPEPLPVREWRSAKLSLWRHTLALALAGLVWIVLGVFPCASARSLSLTEKRGKPANHQAARLMINEATPSPEDQPVPLGVSVDSANDLNFLKVSGLPTGTALSSGVSVGDDGWLLYGKDSKGAVIWPPPHFVGVMKLTISLIVGGDVNASEMRLLRFKWVAEKVAEIRLPEETQPESKGSGRGASISKDPGRSATSGKGSGRSATSGSDKKSNDPSAFAERDGCSVEARKRIGRERRSCSGAFGAAARGGGWQCSRSLRIGGNLQSDHARGASRARTVARLGHCAALVRESQRTGVARCVARITGADHQGKLNRAYSAPDQNSRNFGTTRFDRSQFAISRKKS